MPVINARFAIFGGKRVRKLPPERKLGNRYSDARRFRSALITTAGLGGASWTAPAERSGDGAFERAKRVEFSTRAVRAKAVSRSACHRSPKSSLSLPCPLTKSHGHTRPS